LPNSQNPSNTIPSTPSTFPGQPTYNPFPQTPTVNTGGDTGTSGTSISYDSNGNPILIDRNGNPVDNQSLSDLLGTYLQDPSNQGAWQALTDALGGPGGQIPTVDPGGGFGDIPYIPLPDENATDYGNYGGGGDYSGAYDGGGDYAGDSYFG
jgi:hypothetical protein